MKTRLEIRVDKNYGNTAYYPNCEQSKLIAEIAGTKTLTRHTIANCYRLGFFISLIGNVPTDDANTFARLAQQYN